MSYPDQPLRSGAERRSASGRPVESQAPGRPLPGGDDRFDALVADLTARGCTYRGDYWTCPRCGGPKRRLHVIRHKREPGAVTLHCQKCDAGRKPRQPSLVLETLGWKPYDVYPESTRERFARERRRDPHRAVTERCSHVLDSSMGVDETRARAAALGASVDTPFRCVIAGHEHEASLQWEGRFWLYRCPGRALGLADVRAAVAYGDVRAISPTEAQRWRDRLDYEAGLLEPVGVVIELPDDCGPSARRVSRGVALYLGTRARRGGFGPDEPFTFARRFCMAWCGLTNDQARDGVTELERRGVTARTGEKIAGAILWQLAPVARGLNLEAAPPAIEGLERSLAVDPPIPPDDQRFVDRTEVRAGAHVGVVAGRDAAAVWDREHAADDNPRIGCQARLPVGHAPVLVEPDRDWLREIHRRFGGGA